MIDFLSVINPPPTEDDMVANFWQAAPPALRSLAIAAGSEIDIIIRNLIRGDAMLWASVSNIGTQLVSLSAATGPWLTILAKGRYDQNRINASATVGNLNLTSTVSSSTGAITLLNAQTGVTYTGRVSGLSVGHHASVTFTASQNGPIGDCDFAALTMQSSPAGVVFDTSVGYANANNSLWITYRGAGDESDAHLKQRCYDVIHLRSSGGQSSIAAQIRLATSNQVWRVWMPRFRSSVYVAGLGGPASPAWESATLLAAQKYSNNSVDPVIVGCATPIVITTLRVVGSVTFANGTNSSVVSSVLQGLSDYINQLPICTGEGKDQITVATLERRVLELDTSNTALPSFGVIVNGVRALAIANPIIAPPGTLYQADLSALTVGYK